MVKRYELSNAQWDRIKDILPGDTPSATGYVDFGFESRAHRIVTAATPLSRMGT